MALREFWSNVRTAARLHTPRATVDTPALDAGQIERALRGAALWLTPRAVAGFRAEDFDYLPEAERGVLSTAVERFRAVAAEVRPDGPAEPDQIERALPPFRQIVELLEFDRFGDAEAFRIGKQVEQRLAERWPSELAELRFVTGRDSTGNPAAWVWAVLTDEAAGIENFGRSVRAMSELLETVTREVEPDRWPYVRFRTVSEQVEIHGAGTA